MYIVTHSRKYIYYYSLTVYIYPHVGIVLPKSLSASRVSLCPIVRSCIVICDTSRGAGNSSNVYTWCKHFYYFLSVFLYILIYVHWVIPS